MIDALKGTDHWFVELLAVLLGGYFLWSIRGILKDIRDSIQKLFVKYDDHEHRLSRLEGKCESNHKGKP